MGRKMMKSDEKEDEEVNRCGGKGGREIDRKFITGWKREKEG